MGSISKGSDTFFRLSPAGDGKALCFAIRRGEVTGRADVIYHQPWVHKTLKLLEAARYTTHNLGEVLATIRYGTGTPPPYVNPGPNTVPFVRATDIKEGEVQTDTLLHISSKQPKHMEKCRLAGDEVIVVRSGVNTGDCAVVPQSLAGAYAAYDLILTFQNTMNPSFVVTFLDTEIGRLQLNLVRGRAAQPHVNADELSSVRIPLPPIKKQDELVAAMHSARTERRQKLAEADILLSMLDCYILDTLGLDLNPPQHVVYAVRSGEARRRIDADFHSPKFQTIRREIEHGHYPAVSIHELCESVLTGFAAGKADQAFDLEKGVPHLRPLNLNIYGELSIRETKFVPKDSVGEGDWCQQGEVLFNNTNSTEMVGKSAVFDLEQPCVCSNHITRLRLRSGVDAYYLAALFNAFRRIGYLGMLSTNFNNQAGINTETLLSLKVPSPPEKVQKSIADELAWRREEARRLRAEAETGWQVAKRWFEEQLLGTTQL